MIRVIVGKIMMAKDLCILIAVLFIVPLSACEQVYADSRAVIQSASEPDYPPFCIVSPDGKADGFSVELLRAALTAVNLNVAFKIDHWNAIKAELRDGGIQVLPLVGRTPEREAMYDFTFPYLTLHGAIFVKKGDTRINKVSDLADKTVVVMRGDNAEEFARRTSISAHIVAVDSFKQAMELLDAGKYDAVIAQRLMGLQLLNEIKIKNVAPLDIVLNDFRQDFCFAVRTGDKALLSKLNEGLAIIIANGTFDQIHKKWFAPQIQHQITFKDVWKYVLYIMIPILIATTLLSIVLLRREVKRKTTSLGKEIAERKRAEVALRERVKELSALYYLSDLAENPAMKLDELYQLMANEMSRSWQYPEVTCVRIVIGDREFRSSNFAESRWHQSEIIQVEGSVAGKIDVGYLEEKPEQDEGPFLKEERWLLHAIAERIGHITGHKRAEAALLRNSSLLRTMADNYPNSFVSLIEKDLSIGFTSGQAFKKLNLDPNQFVGLTLEQVFGEHTPVVRENYLKSFGGEETRFELFINHQHQQYRTVPLPDPDGNIHRILVVVEDITERKQAESDREKLIADIQKALAEIKTLHGILPICSVCKKIRDDAGSWSQMEVYISNHSEAEFSHSYCPECGKKAMEEVKKYMA